MTKKRSLMDFDSFENSNDKTEKLKGEQKMNNNTEKENVTIKSNNESINESGQVVNNTNNDKGKIEVKGNNEMDVEKEQGNVSNENETIEEKDLLKLFKEKTKRQTVEDTHTRQTFLMRNDLKNRLDKLAKRQSKGFKHHVLNYALEQVLDELENKN